MKDTLDSISKCFESVTCFNFPPPSSNIDSIEAKEGILRLNGIIKKCAITQPYAQT